MTFLPSSQSQPSCDHNCADKPRFTPSRLVVQFGKPASAHCSCCSDLPITVYKPPESVSISFVNHTGPMSEGQKFTLQCEVRKVAPVEHLRVTFYRGQTALGHTQSSINTDEKPVSEAFTLNITSTKEDHGVQFWCEAKLELGADGPQPPPVVGSEKLTAAVLYKPQLEASVPPDPIIITEGNPLTLNCSSVGNPPPSYTWTAPPSRITSPSNGSVFIIKSITHKDEGSYTCSVHNAKGEITVQFNVKVQDLPPTTLPTTTTSTTPSNTMITTTSTPPTTMITTTSTPTTTKTTTTATTTTPNKEPPENVSFSVHPGVPMSEGQQFTLQCEVQKVAPVGNLRVTFYRGQTALGLTQSSINTDEKPVSEVFTLNITSTKEDHGVQFWCEAKLELGADGPQPPPVVGSEKLTAAVLYKPQREVSITPDLIIIKEGNPLKLNCSSVGNPPPSYEWTPPSRITSPSNGSVFFINSITHKDEGSYTCYVSNEKGSIAVQFDVTVKADNHILIVGLVVASVLLAVIVGVAVSISYHRYYKVGAYNLLWDRIRLHTTHSSIPTAE
ncbi:hypothetical protein CesoFtcFv8_008526 [Champsocephalus esox]|uniref:Ig-like domain-containing protein n=1 Tax=Champsocephalus esox TaxID=159716 RepID=A0AAN8H473_9TELE|nr:hypothetical protein CesoFtcFv8_008526 [Champsocephalus esox]